MEGKFQIGLTRDFIGPDGRMTYRDIGLGLLDKEPSCTYGFLDEYKNPLLPEQIASYDAILSLTPGWKAETFAKGA